MSSLQEEYFACLALRYTPGLGPKSWSPILRHYSTAYEGLKDAANWHSLSLASEKSATAAIKELWRTKAEQEYREAIRLGFGILPWTHPLFPRLLKELPDPPTCLYYFGDPELLGNPAVGVVGSRKSGALGQEYAARIAADLSKSGITIVSGFAKGIDSCAHEAALQGIGSTIAVLGAGLDVESYPPDSAWLRKSVIESGLIISEFPPGTKPFARNFPFRNRLISGLSTGVLVVEAEIASGSLVTARLAGEQGREVMAMPGPIGNSSFAGCLKLIKEGAALVETADDVIMNIGHALDLSTQGKTVEIERRFPAEKKVLKSKPIAQVPVQQEVESAVLTFDIDALEPPESDVAKSLESGGRMHIDEIARAAGIDVSIAGAVILGMEVKGMVVRFPGMYYDLKRC
ncbi:DNA-processing protein DprA [Desulfovibrio sp. JC022]|uniref:DNA-processing protein DprA n=1 Tax=Desulfovibrio sp. JC022 TaxID=2593642 RepID=UPI0013D2F2A1|nr:DNA-protecting protein DprA [Desulfovibrio sp. JC022]